MTANRRTPAIPWTFRRIAPSFFLLFFGGAVAWSLSFSAQPPADFTFINGTELKSVDPAIVTGAPEGRIVSAIFEGLLNWDPKDLHPIPGVAELPAISDDGLTYTFRLRPNAMWTRQEEALRPVTAHDFVYSFRRFLHPGTAAEYSYQLYYVRGAEKFARILLEPGDAVEIELKEKAPDALPFAPGKIIRGKLVSIEDGESATDRVYVVDIDGRERRFSKSGDGEDYEFLLPDFNDVGIRAIDDRTLVIELNHPTPYFVNLMGFYPLSPVQRECVEEFGYPRWTKPENIATNGAFYLEFRHLRDRIRLRKNPNYWNASNVALNVIDALAVSDSTTALNLYLTGNVDWLTTVPNSVIERLIAQNREDFQPAPFLGIYYYRINTQRRGLNDPRVRRALSMAVDREEIVRAVTRAGEIPAKSFVPPGVPGYESASLPPQDIEAARALLAEAGFPGGRGLPTLEILYNDLDAHGDIAELIQSQWKRNLGVEVRLRKLEWGTYLSETRTGNYYLSRAGWIGDYVDPNTFLDLFVTDGANNQTGWSNAEYDRLIQEAASESDPEKRMAMLQKAEAILLDELPVLPLYYYVSKNMVRPYVKGFYQNLQDVHPLDAIRIDEEAKEKFFAERTTP